MRPERRPGFTLIELLVVVMIVGTLAGLAVPNLRTAMLRADAAHVLSDARSIRLAAHQYLSDHGQFPPSGAPGVVPTELADILPNVPFDYKGLTYTWYSYNLSGMGFSGDLGSNNLGILMIQYGDRTDIGNALSAFQGPDLYWSSEVFYMLTWD